MNTFRKVHNREASFQWFQILWSWEALFQRVVGEDDDLSRTKLLQDTALDFASERIAISPTLQRLRRQRTVRRPFLDGDYRLVPVTVPPLVNALGEVIWV